jgi:hypothetical protein
MRGVSGLWPQTPIFLLLSKNDLSKYILYNYQCRKFATCYVGVAADDVARCMRELKISSLISCEPGTSDITHVSSVLSRVSRHMGQVLLFTFLWTCNVHFQALQKGDHYRTVQKLINFGTF